MSFKVLGDFPNHYMIQHPDGTSFPVAKKGISEDLHQKIKAMGTAQNPRKYADGGMVDPIDDGGSSQMSAQDSLSDLQPQQPPPQGQIISPSIFEQAKGVAPEQSIAAPSSDSIFTTIKNNLIPGGALPKQPEDQVSTQLPQLKQSQPSPGIKPASYETGTPDLAKTNNPYDDRVKGLDAQQGALGTFTKQMNEANAMSAKANSDMINGLKSIDDTHQQVMQKYQAANAQLSDDFMNGKLDPNRFYGSMNTGNKVMAAISLALGGIGSGLTGKSNAALDVISSAINRDMESQKNDMERQKSAVMLNHEAQRDESQNYAMKKASLITAAQAQIGLAASKSQNAQAVFQAKSIAQGLEDQKQTLLKDAARKQAIMDEIGKNPDNTLAYQVGVKEFVPEKQQEQAYKELDRVLAANKARDSINKYMGSATDKNTIMGRLVHGGFEPADMSALEANVMPVIRDLEGKVNEKEMEVLRGLYPHPGDSASKIKTKISGLNDFISSKSNSSLLSSNGIMPRSTGVYNIHGQKNFREGAPK